MMSMGAVRKHRAEECLDCTPHHDLDRVAMLEGSGLGNEAERIPVWVEREGRDAGVARIRVAKEKGILEKFAILLSSLARLFRVPCTECVNIFEEDTHTVAFNSNALFFNLRYFVEEAHASEWEDAVSFWMVSFAHELAHFESQVHDRRHGRAMEHAHRAVLPGLPRVLSSPWGASGSGCCPAFLFRNESGDSI